MKKKTTAHLHFRPNYGLFIGKLNDNLPHQHYAIQISVCLQKTMKLTLEDRTSERSNFFLPSNISHQLISPQTHLTILLHPISRIGYYLRYIHQTNTDFEIEESLLQQLMSLLKQQHLVMIDFSEFCSHIDLLFDQFVNDFEQAASLKDDRIAKSIQYLDEHYDRTVSLEEIAKVCFLSPSRFLHLFKEKTQTTFRRYKLWSKLIASLSALHHQSITATAHQFGFTDSSHYTRTFKETFGVTPKQLLQSK